MESTAAKIEGSITGLSPASTRTAAANQHVSQRELIKSSALFDCPPVGAATDCRCCPAAYKSKCIPPVIDAEESNRALAMVAQLRGRVA